MELPPPYGPYPHNFNQSSSALNLERQGKVLFIESFLEESLKLISLEDKI